MTTLVIATDLAPVEIEITGVVAIEVGVAPIEIEASPVSAITLVPVGVPGPPGQSGADAVAAHVAASDPHPQYAQPDPGDVTLIFDNHLI